MEESKSVKGEKFIDSKKARTVLISAIVGYLLLGLVIGYAFIWNQYSTGSRYEQEIKDAAKKVQETPNDIDARLDLGFKYMRAKQYDKAKGEFNAALKIDPNNNSTKLNMAFLYIEMNNYKEADKILDAVAKVEPGFQVFALRGKSKLLQKKYNPAIQDLMSARDINPTDTEVLYNLGLSYEKSGDNKMAEASYKDALQYDPSRQDAKDGLKRVQGK